MWYQFKPGPELVWAFIVAIVGVLTLAVGAGEPPADLKVWLLALVPALVRAVFGVILHVMGSPPPVAP